jgi:hypothetical protein
LGKKENLTGQAPYFMGKKEKCVELPEILDVP